MQDLRDLSVYLAFGSHTFFLSVSVPKDTHEQRKKNYESLVVLDKLRTGTKKKMNTQVHVISMNKINSLR